MNKYAMMIVLLSSSGNACAQDAPAQRYIDDQSVEIIQNRSLAHPGQGAPTPAWITARGGVLDAASGAAPGSARAVAAVDPKLRIGAREQDARDQEREAILRQELQHETSKYEAATKTLAQAEQAARSQPQVGAVLKQLKEVLHAHQQNIESLAAELQRTRAAG